MAHIWINHGTHLNESWHTFKWAMSHKSMSHGTHEWDMVHKWMSHVTHMQRRDSCKFDAQITCSDWSDLRFTYKWVMAHIWMSHVTHMNESCHMNEVCQMNEGAEVRQNARRLIQVCDITHMCDKWVMSHVYSSHSTQMGHVTLMNESCHTHEWVMSHMRIWASNDTSQKPPRIVIIMTHSWVCHTPFICVTWLIHECAMIHLFVWHDSLICENRLYNLCLHSTFLASRL